MQDALVVINDEDAQPLKLADPVRKRTGVRIAVRKRTTGARMTDVIPLILLEENLASRLLALRHESKPFSIPSK
jgi:hypothetical protein